MLLRTKNMGPAEPGRQDSNALSTAHCFPYHIDLRDSVVSAQSALCQPAGVKGTCYVKMGH